jgi:hypothetical protein
MRHPIQNAHASLKANIWLLDEAACNERSGRQEPPDKEKKTRNQEEAIRDLSRVPSAAAAVKGLRSLRDAQRTRALDGRPRYG